MVKQFLKEPWWFKLLLSTTLLFSIVFSSSFLSNNAYYFSISKLAAAIFFCAYGIKTRRNFVTSFILFSLSVICIYLSIQSFFQWTFGVIKFRYEGKRKKNVKKPQGYGEVRIFMLHLPTLVFLPKELMTLVSKVITNDKILYMESYFSYGKYVITYIENEPKRI